MSATDSNIACNTGFRTPISSEVINVPAGAKVGAYWGHVIGGAQSSNDADNPIAKSHKGKQYYSRDPRSIMLNVMQVLSKPICECFDLSDIHQGSW
jgi:hypothetical protein